MQEVGFAMLRDLGITLIAADSPTSFLDDGPTSKLIRQILGAVAEFDKAMTVANLREHVSGQGGDMENVRAASHTLSGKAGRPWLHWPSNLTKIRMAALTHCGRLQQRWPIRDTSRPAGGTIQRLRSLRC